MITKKGKPIAKLVAINEPSAPNVEGLLTLLSKEKNAEDISLDQRHEERINRC